MVKTLLFSLLFLLFSCGKNEVLNPITETDTTCTSSMAVIAVYDGFYQRMCGCAEAEGTRVYSPDTLTCTLSKNSVVFFQYFSPSQPAQIVPTGTLQITSSPIYNPRTTGTQRSFAVQMTETGTYSFKNAYNPQMVGQIIVQ